MSSDEYVNTSTRKYSILLICDARFCAMQNLESVGKLQTQEYVSSIYPVGVYFKKYLLILCTVKKNHYFIKFYWPL
jgi:hypothetical protein